MSQSRIFRKIWHTGSDDGIFERAFLTEEAATQYAIEKTVGFYKEPESEWQEIFWIYSEDLYE